MASDVIYFENPNTGARREAPVGFSWTVLFFGGFVPLVRGDWGYFFIMLVANFFRLKKLSAHDNESYTDLKLNKIIFYLASYGYIFLVLAVTHYIDFRNNL